MGSDARTPERHGSGARALVAQHAGRRRCHGTHRRGSQRARGPASVQPSEHRGWHCRIAALRRGHPARQYGGRCLGWWQHQHAAIHGEPAPGAGRREREPNPDRYRQPRWQRLRRGGTGGGHSQCPQPKASDRDCQQSGRIRRLLDWLFGIRVLRDPWRRSGLHRRVAGASGLQPRDGRGRR